MISSSISYHDHHSSPSSTDAAFAHEIENMWNTYSDPAYKSLVVELFCVLAAILKRNPELQFAADLDVEALIDQAVAMFKTVSILLFFLLLIAARLLLYF